MSKKRLFPEIGRKADSSIIIQVHKKFAIDLEEMSTEVEISENAEEITFPTAHPEVSTLLEKPADVWQRRRVLIRDILCAGSLFRFLWELEDHGLAYVGKSITIGGWTRTIRKQVV